MDGGPFRDDTARKPASEAEVTPDIEILEVVGVDEDGEPIEPVDPDDVEIEFEGIDPDPPEPIAVALREPPPDVSEEIRLKERLVRLQAEFENFRKRIDREHREHYRYAMAGLVGKILPVLDNFDRAMASARPGSPNDALVAGFALIQRQLVGELEAEGLRAMESVGETFDPVRHEAVAMDHDSPVPPHTVTEVFQRGYYLHDRVLRPALVRVRVEAEGGNGSDKES